MTGSREGEETPLQTARRELHEETGLDASHHVLSDWGVQNRYEIPPQMAPPLPGRRHPQHRTRPGPDADMPLAVRRWRRASIWPGAGCPGQAAAEQVFSPSNADAIRLLPARLAHAAQPA